MAELTSFVRMFPGCAGYEAAQEAGVISATVDTTAMTLNVRVRFPSMPSPTLLQQLTGGS